MKKILVFLLCLAIVGSLIACGNNTGNIDSGNKETANQDAPTETNQPDNTEESLPTESGKDTIDKITDPKDGTVLDVDLTVRGEIQSNAPTMNSGKFILEGKTMGLPFDGSLLANEGWHFSENNTAKDAQIEPNSTTNLVSFYLYDTDGNALILDQAINNSDTAKPVLECQISSFRADTLELYENFGDLILPGGISLRSCAADVIDVFGAPENNSNFERVEVSAHGIRYVENKASGLCYSFLFYSSEDYNGEANGYIRSIHISTDY